MLLLTLLNFTIVVGCVLFVFTQILLPLHKNTPLFPLFRSSPLRDKVDETREVVADLRDQVAAQRDLSELQAEQEQLEAQIKSASNDSKSVINKE